MKALLDKLAKTKRPPLALVGVLTLVGFLLVVTGTATSAANQSLEPRRQALVDQVLQQRSDVDDLDTAVAALRGQVTEARAAAGAASARTQEEADKELALAVAAGTVAVKGNGVEVKMTDAERTGDGEDAKFDANRIQDSDLQLTVNALFAAGAEAVAINDNRIVSVTPIRAAGGTIVVNYRPVNSPYRIVAIGADKKRFEASEIAIRFAQWKKKYALGFSVENKKNLEAPGYAGGTSIALAQSLDAVTTPTPGAPTSTSQPQGASEDASTAGKG